MKYKKYLLIAAALVMVAAAGVSPAMAYFTDSHTASGMVTLSLGDSKVVPKEDFDDSYNKLITISNTGSFEVMVRVKAIYGDNCTVTLDETSSSGWSDGGDGYFYYASPLAGKTEDADGGVTSQLKLIVAAKEGVTDDFNVIIVEEAAKVYYENGVAKADWNQAAVQEDTSLEDTSLEDSNLEDTDVTENNGGEE